jgi:hypothetical protein
MAINWLMRVSVSIPLKTPERPRSLILFFPY